MGCEIEEDTYQDKPEIIEGLLLHNSHIHVSESLVSGLIYCWEGSNILEKLCKHGKPLFCTQNIVAAAAKGRYGPQTLTFILQKYRDAKISHTMIMMAMRARFGAALISVMLQHDHTIIMEVEHLITAASNPHELMAILEYLHSKGKLGSSDFATEALKIGSAKRRRISHRSPPRVSTSVVDAAFTNPKEGIRLKLLELFVEWNVIAQADLDDRMYDAPFTIEWSPPSSPKDRLKFSVFPLDLDFLVNQNGEGTIQTLLRHNILDQS